MMAAFRKGTTQDLDRGSRQGDAQTALDNNHG